MKLTVLKNRKITTIDVTLSTSSKGFAKDLYLSILKLGQDASVEFIGDKLDDGSTITGILSQSKIKVPQEIKDFIVDDIAVKKTELDQVLTQEEVDAGIKASILDKKDEQILKNIAKDAGNFYDLFEMFLDYRVDLTDSSIVKNLYDKVRAIGLLPVEGGFKDKAIAILKNMFAIALKVVFGISLFALNTALIVGKLAIKLTVDVVTESIEAGKAIGASFNNDVIKQFKNNIPTSTDDVKVYTVDFNTTVTD